MISEEVRESKKIVQSSISALVTVISDTYELVDLNYNELIDLIDTKLCLILKIIEGNKKQFIEKQGLYKKYKLDITEDIPKEYYEELYKEHKNYKLYIEEKLVEIVYRNFQKYETHKITDTAKSLMPLKCKCTEEDLETTNKAIIDEMTELYNKVDTKLNEVDKLINVNATDELINSTEDISLIEVVCSDEFENEIRKLNLYDKEESVEVSFYESFDEVENETRKLNLYDKEESVEVSFYESFDEVENKTSKLDFHNQGQVMELSFDWGFDEVENAINNNESEKEIFNKIVDKIEKTFDHIVKSNCIQEIKPVSIIGFSQDDDKDIRGYICTLFGNTLDNINKVFQKDLTMESRLKLIDKQRKLKKDPFGNEDILGLATNFEKLIKRYCDLNTEYFTSIFGISAAEIIIEKKQVHDPSKTYNNDDNYVNLLSYVAQRSMELSNKAVNNTTVIQLSVSIKELISDIKSFESLKNQMVKNLIKNLLYHDDNVFEVDEKKYNDGLKKFDVLINGKIKKLHTAVRRSERGLLWDIVKGNEYPNLTFEKCWENFKATNNYIIEKLLPDKTYIIEELEKNELLKDAFNKSKTTTTRCFRVIDNLVKRISPEKNKINCLMLSYVMEQFENFFIRDYKIFSQKIMWALFVWQESLEKLSKIQGRFKRFIDNDDLLIYLSCLIKIVIPDISDVKTDVKKIDAFKSNELISCFLLVRFVKTLVNKIIGYQKDNIKENEESVKDLCDRYLPWNNGDGLSNAQRGEIGRIIEKVSEDEKKYIKSTKKLFDKLNKLIGDNGFVPISQQVDIIPALTEGDIDEILCYIIGIDDLSRSMGEIYNSLRGYKLNIPKCFKELNTEEDLKKAWTEYQKQ